MEEKTFRYLYVTLYQAYLIDGNFLVTIGL